MFRSAKFVAVASLLLTSAACAPIDEDLETNEEGYVDTGAEASSSLQEHTYGLFGRTRQAEDTKNTLVNVTKATSPSGVTYVRLQKNSAAKIDVPTYAFTAGGVRLSVTYLASSVKTWVNVKTFVAKVDKGTTTVEFPSGTGWKTKVVKLPQSVREDYYSFEVTNKIVSGTISAAPAIDKFYIEFL